MALVFSDEEFRDGIKKYLEYCLTRGLPTPENLELAGIRVESERDDALDATSMSPCSRR